MSPFNLADPRSGDTPRASTLAAVFRELRRLGNVRGSSGIDVRSHPGGIDYTVKIPPGSISAVVATGGITAAPSANKLGQGNAVLRFQSGEDLTDGPAVKVWSNFSVDIPSGTRIEVAPSGPDYKLIGADCPP